MLLIYTHTPAPTSGLAAALISQAIYSQGTSIKKKENGKVDTFWSLRAQVDGIVGTEDISDACGHHSMWCCDAQEWRVLATAKKLHGLLKLSGHWQRAQACRRNGMPEKADSLTGQ